MAENEPERITYCRECGQEFRESPPAQASRIVPVMREPCPNCGSTAREYRVTGTVIAGMSAAAVATVPPPSVVVENLDGTFTRKVTWSKTPDCWLVEVHDADGNLVGFELALDAQDAFLLLDEHVMPPET